jgi:hypothetical protein
MQGATDALQARKVGLAKSLDLQVYAMRRDLLQHGGPAGGAGNGDGETQPFDLQYLSGHHAPRSHVLPTISSLFEITVQCALQQCTFFDQVVPITICVDATILSRASRPLVDYFVSDKSTHAGRFNDNMANTHKWLCPADLRRLHDHPTVATDVGGAPYEDLTTIDMSEQSAPFQILSRLRSQWTIRSDLQHVVIQSHCLDA